ncbi:MAG TPA: hypothetical protein VK831_02475 [Candidatus Deferrimicrobiaceae bacterium]|nr:hypothetical protein [Candidatus Deferrimicrobiaceae bacterium]
MPSYRIPSRVAPLVAAVALTVLAMPAVAAPEPCAGAGWVAPDFATFEQRVEGQVTQVTFEFYGEHPLCLADGSQVTGTVTGRLWQQNGPNGAVSLRFDEVLSYGGGTLGYRGEATFNAAGWVSHVRTVGPGTGILEGISGQGWFSPIDPNTGAFTDEIAYTYN